MKKQTEALKMAIEYIDKLKSTGQTNWLEINVIQNACKEALEQPAKNIRDSFNEMLEDKVAYYKGKQPAQEPVAWMHRHEGEITEFNDFQSCDKCEPLYTHHAPSWQGLSDDEINDIVNKIRDDMYPWKDGMLVGKVARAIEQALKERNHGNN